MIADLLRACAVDGLALGLALILAPALRGWGLAAGAALALSPALVVAWAWSVGPWSGLHPQADLLHLVLAAARLAPWLALVAMLLPEPIPPAALHAARLAGGRAGPAWRWRLRGPGRRWLTAALAVWPLAFAEFELASRLAVDAWAVRLFDAQAGGLPLARTLELAAPGMLVSLLALAAAVALAPRRGDPAGIPVASRGQRMLAAGVLLALLAGLVVWPLARVVLAAQGEFAGMVGGLKPALAMAVLGGLAATLAWLLSGVLRRSNAATLLIVIPGCLGGLPLGLAAAAVLPAGLAATPLPWLVALTLLLLPAAVLLRRLAAPPAAALHSAELLGADPARAPALHRLRWLLAGRRAWLACAALGVLGCWELPASALLHPAAMPPLPVQLYNLMHYGESPALAARLALALLAPLLPAALFAAAWRWR